MKLKNIRYFMFYVVLILAWQACVWLKFWPEYMFPSPVSVLQSLWDGFSDRTMLIAVAVSLKRVFIGFTLSIALGGLLGLFVSRSKFLEKTVGGLLLGIQTLPSICWLPLALLWFGLNEKAIYFVVIMGALCSIAIAVQSGIKNVSPIYVNAGRNMGAQGNRLFYNVILPASFPYILSGLKQGWSFAWRSLMAGELLFLNLGLGYLLMMGRELNDMSRVIAVMLVIACISILVEKHIFGKMETLLRKRWGMGKSF
jgi:NitT/TauT family transport system permease protein